MPKINFDIYNLVYLDRKHPEMVASRIAFLSDFSIEPVV